MKNILDENNLHNYILSQKEKQMMNTSVQQNQLHKNNRNVISGITLFSTLFYF